MRWVVLVMVAACAAMVAGLVARLYDRLIWPEVLGLAVLAAIVSAVSVYFSQERYGRSD